MARCKLNLDLTQTAKAADELNRAFTRLSDAFADGALALDDLAETIQRLKDAGMIDAEDRDAQEQG